MLGGEEARKLERKIFLTADRRRQAQTFSLLWPTLARVKLHALRAVFGSS
jgi:hypothetical protein